jgi:hypothetical protein
MTKTSQTATSNVSRRCLLKTAVCMAGTVPILGTVVVPETALAASQVSKSSVRYTDTAPSAAQTCANCRSFVAPNSCKTVAGEVSGRGWCGIWIPKG